MLPLFPTWRGTAPSKLSVVSTILAAAGRLGVPLAAPAESTRISGHTLRATGAQGLTRLGLDLWAVQLLGRWGSHTVTLYIRDAAASTEAAISRRHLVGTTLRSLVADIAGQRQGQELEHVTRATVQNTVRELLPELAEQMRELLADAVAERVRARASSKDSSSSSSSSSASPVAAAPPPSIPTPAPQPAPPPPFEQDVSSKYSSTRHRIMVGPEATLEQGAWVTLCSWKFGRPGAARKPEPGDRLCDKCFPSAGS